MFMDGQMHSQTRRKFVKCWLYSFLIEIRSITRDLLKSNPQFEQEQLSLWFHNRTGITFFHSQRIILISSFFIGVLSAAPRSLGIAAASNLFSSAQLDKVIRQTEDSITHYARQFSNGNEKLAKGIEAQYMSTVQLWKRGKLAPVELNLGKTHAYMLAIMTLTHNHVL